MLINVADLKDPNDTRGRSYRDVNAEKTHGIPLGTLVEMESGARLFVVMQGRDCDQTPLYWLAPHMPEFVDEPNSYAHRSERMKWIGGYSEDELGQIAPPKGDV